MRGGGVLEEGVAGPENRNNSPFCVKASLLCGNESEGALQPCTTSPGSEIGTVVLQSLVRSDQRDGMFVHSFVRLV